ncbi:MAG TPA: hypothetical protein VJU87_12320 [Gemmatimonadaceae bacterium]|nr:hypothetical protein [Gemmatimonadaceae bacterium]
MTALFRASTVSVSIERPPERVYQFASDGRNLPLWITSFIRAVHATGDGWAAETPAGSLPIRFVAPNTLGVLDHYVGPGAGLPEVVLNPMRVVANGSGSEVLFTLFQMPGMSAEQYAADLEMVRSDLATLKRVLETGDA